MESFFLIQVALLILICIFLNNVSAKLGMPALLVFIVLGLIFGNHGVVTPEYISFSYAQSNCELALIFIMFYGGFAARWDSVRPVVAEASLLATFGVLITAGLTGLFCHFVFRWDWLPSMLTGAVVSCTDAASVFSILKSKRLNLKGNAAPMIEAESGSNDPIAHMLTLLLISLMKAEATPGGMVLEIVLQIVVGLALGVGIAKGAAWVLSHLHFGSESLNTLFIFSVAILAFAVPEELHGNGFLSVYLVGLLLGKEDFGGKKALVHFFDGIILLMEVLLFFMLGALANPALFPKAILPAVAIYLFLLLAARPAAVMGILTPFRRYSLRQQGLTVFAGLRGASSIVFAIIVVNETAVGEYFFNIIFCLVFLSVMVQGLLLPYMSRRLDMIDDKANVLKTFNDYVDDDVRFGRVDITASSRWNGRMLREIDLPEGMIVALVIRGGEQLMPRGHLLLQEGDLVVTLTHAFDGQLAKLHEKTVKVDSRRVGHSIRENPGTSIIVMIKRGDECIIPSGDTILEAGDRLVILDIIRG